LALFALAVQLTVTFGHVHVDGFYQVSTNAIQTAAADQALTPLGEAHNNGQPAAVFDCPICALIQLASTSAPSAAPPLPIPAMLGRTILPAHAAPCAASPRLAFQPRGPPAV
jgi:hypothetical protein